MDGLYYSYSACEDDQTFPKAFPAAGYDKDNSAVTLNSYATYSKQVSIARILGSPRGWKVYPGFPIGLPWVPVFSPVFVRFP